MSVNEEAEQAHQYRLMQASRLISFLEENGVDLHSYVADPSILDISPILDADGKIIPESGTADRLPPSTGKRVVRVPTGNTEPEPPRRIVREGEDWTEWRREQGRLAREGSEVKRQSEAAYEQGVAVGEKLQSLGLGPHETVGGGVYWPAGAADELRTMPEAEVLWPHLEKPPPEHVAGHLEISDGRPSWVHAKPGGYRFPTTPFTKGMADGARRLVLEKHRSIWRKVTGQEGG